MSRGDIAWWRLRPEEILTGGNCERVLTGGMRIVSRGNIDCMEGIATSGTLSGATVFRRHIDWKRLAFVLV